MVGEVMEFWVFLGDNKMPVVGLNFCAKEASFMASSKATERSRYVVIFFIFGGKGREI